MIECVPQELAVYVSGVRANEAFGDTVDAGYSIEASGGSFGRYVADIELGANNGEFRCAIGDARATDGARHEDAR
jgi:hypothetical protein